MSVLRKDRRIESCWQLSRASGACCLHGDSRHDGLGLARRYNTELRMEDGCNAQQWEMGSHRAHVAGI